MVAREVSGGAADDRLGAAKPSELTILAESSEVGLGLLDDPSRRSLHMFNHIEYDTRSLADEYFRDLRAACGIDLPSHYFPDDDPQRPPANRWRGHAHLLFGNWIDAIYQTTPFDRSLIGLRAYSSQEWS